MSMNWGHGKAGCGSWIKLCREKLRKAEAEVAEALKEESGRYPVSRYANTLVAVYSM